MSESLRVALLLSRLLAMSTVDHLLTPGVFVFSAFALTISCVRREHYLPQVGKHVEIYAGNAVLTPSYSATSRWSSSHLLL